MKFLRTASLITRVIIWIVQAVAMLALGVVVMLYSPGAQDHLRRSVVSWVNRSDGTKLQIERLRLRFPLKLELGGVMMAQDGDTMVRVGALDADVRLMPLLGGNVMVRHARLDSAYYRIGAPDSAMYMTISAAQALLKPATVDLKTMGITLDDGVLRHARVDMTLNPDTTATDTTNEQQQMLIRLRHLAVEDLVYNMRMMPTIDSLGTTIGHATLNNGVIDLGRQTLQLQAIVGDSLNAAYIAPSAAAVAAMPRVPEQPETDTPSQPWTITIDTISFTGSQALYTTRGLKPQPGLDFGYIAVSDVDLGIYNFYNQAEILRMPLRLSTTERCGLHIDATGEFMLNATEMVLRDFDIHGPSTAIVLNAMMGMGDLATDPTLPLRLRADGYAGLADLRTMFPGYAAYLSLFPRGGAMGVDADIDGTPRRLDVRNLALKIAGCASLQARGSVDNVMDPDRIGGDIALTGNIINVKSIVNAFVDPSAGLSVPPMTLKGNISYHPGVTKGDLTATTMGGRIALKGGYTARNDGYDVDLQADDFPVNAFMADLGVGRATLDIKAHGNGFDLFRQSTRLDAQGTVKSLVYNGYDYRNISLDAHIADGVAAIDGLVDTDDLEASIKATGNLDGDVYTWQADLDGRVIDLYALKLVEEPTVVSVSMQGNASMTPDMHNISADINLADLLYSTKDMDIDVSDVNAHFVSNDTLTTLNVHNRDLVADVWMPLHFSNIADGFVKATDIAIAQVKNRSINVDTLQRVLPQFNINLVCGDNNMITDILRSTDMSLEHLSIEARNDSSLYMCTNVLGFTTGATRLDSIDVDLLQQHEKMHLIAVVNNRRGTLDDWAHLKADGMINGDKVALRITQQNIDDRTGFDIGAITSLADSTVTARIFPLKPVIGYKNWTVNIDNFLRYDFYTHRVDANLKMKGDNSSLQLLSEQTTDSLGNRGVNDILLKIGDIHLADWISFNPFAPPINGNLSADMRVKWDGGTNINGKGDISLTDFFYDNRKVASLNVGMNVETNLGGTIRAQADVMVDGEKTMSLAGNLNDSISGSPFNLDFSLIRFPLSTVNPFLPADVAQLTGVLNGNMLISGDADHPLINGEIYFDNAAVKAAITNTSYRFSDVKIPVNDNVVTLKDFSIKGANENPLYVNGEVNLATLASPDIDLKMAARNLMLVNTSKAARGAQIYGKGYIDLDASVRGNLRFMLVDADLTLLAGSNLTYVLSFDDTSLTTTTNEGMVKFVNLSDTSAVAAADSIQSAMMMQIDAQLNLQNGTTINVDLPTGSRDKVVIQPQGSLTYTQSPMSVDGRLTGRINLNSGMARYTLPVVGSEKQFTLNQGSYVAFNGDLLNPVLHLSATDAVKCNVTQEGQNSRMVNFNILLDVTGTLEQMDVKFDLTTNDDITVANELQAMSAEQRANQAMNMLLYNMYTGPGSSGNINLSANPLFSFLESQINNWAAQNIKGVDLSFGIDQYNQTTNGTTSSAMTYSYQVSKTLFNDRFKIVVGGNYSTDNNADENIAENLINDISFEYYLNSQQTMLVKLFRHQGYESILEGEITQTGVGFVYRRKIDRMSQVLPKFMRPRRKN